MSPHRELEVLAGMFPHTGSDSQADLTDRIRNAARRITMFGLTRNFYASPEMLALFEAKAAAGIPVSVYAMDPHCPSRRDRYRLEPAEAALADPDHYTRTILDPITEAAERTPQLTLLLYDFPCSFAMEEIDDTIRVMLYGHGVRGTDGPILAFGPGTEYHAYFAAQLRWLEGLATTLTARTPWGTAPPTVRPYRRMLHS
ncbi:hypothetical protein [Yinghuangia soli]|uniref:Uncharacterized protein n=1 Tax=Yinghuangia soli TaxID=2908204 RepID=A0AA41Q8S3_9ACTN|nr:hypothetical protein [Yinghuangia soli]MCF2533000.1 hypothetical protein [Yinghuangia soli]